MIDSLVDPQTLKEAKMWQEFTAEKQRMTAEIEQLKASSEKLSRDVDNLLQERGALNSEITALKSEIEALKSGSVHSCNSKCQKLECVQRREIEQFKSKLKIAKEALKKIGNGTGQSSWTDRIISETAIREIGDL